MTPNVKMAAGGLVALLLIGVLVGVSVAYFGGGTAVTKRTVASLRRDELSLQADAPTIQRLLGVTVDYPDFAKAKTPADFTGIAVQFRAAVGDERARIARGQTLVKADLALIDDAVKRGTDAESNFATLFDRDPIHVELGKIGFYRVSLDFASSLLQINDSQLRAVTSFTDGIANIPGLGAKINASDWPGCLSAADSVGGPVNQAGNEAADAHFPAAWDTMLAGFAKFAADVKNACQGVINNDPNGVYYAARQIDLDIANISTIDTTPMDHNDYIAAQVEQMKSYQKQANIT